MWILGLLGVVVLAGALGAVTLRNLVHCALSLIITFAGIAGVFLHLNAEFLGWVQILVYVGAVGILLVFAVLLTRGGEDPAPRFASSWKWGVGIAVLTALLWGGAVLQSTVSKRQPSITGWSSKAGEVTQAGPPMAELGVVLMRDFVIPLEILGVLLTAALIGAMVIALPPTTGEKTPTGGNNALRSGGPVGEGES